MEYGFRSALSAAARRRASAVVTLISLAAAPALGGCGGGEDEPDEPVAGSILLEDDNNYESVSLLTIPIFETATATDIEVCWTDVSSDLQCHEISPTEDLDNVAVSRFPSLSEAEVEARLEVGEIAGTETSGYVELHFADMEDPQATCAMLSDMTFLGNENAFDPEQDYIESDTDSYMLVLAEGTTPAVGTRTMAFLKPTASSDVFSVSAPPGCGASPLLDFTADIASHEPVPVPVDGPWKFDWRAVERDSLGNPLAFTSINGLLLGFYANMTVADVEERILDLEIMATSMWEMELTGGRTADLAFAQNRDSGDLFDGFERDEEGVWMLGLMCSTCSNPAPLVLVVLEPGTE